MCLYCSSYYSFSLFFLCCICLFVYGLSLHFRCLFSVSWESWELIGCWPCQSQNRASSSLSYTDPCFAKQTHAALKIQNTVLLYLVGKRSTMTHTHTDVDRFKTYLYYDCCSNNPKTSHTHKLCTTNSLFPHKDHCVMEKLGFWEWRMDDGQGNETFPISCVRERDSRRNKRKESGDG